MRALDDLRSPADGCDVVVVGGGLAGLVAATTMASRGLDVVLVERATALGGRAASTRSDGFALDRGPRALYIGGPAEQALSRLGIEVPGHAPPLDGWVLTGAPPFAGPLRALPTHPWLLMTTPLLPGRARWQLMRTLIGLRRPASHWRGAVADILDGLDERAAAVLAMLIRLTTYTHAPAQLDADAAMRQLRASFAGVRYIDGGWQTLVDGLAARAAAAGVRQVRGRAVRWHDGALELTDGRRIGARIPLVAAGPDTATAVYDLPPLPPSPDARAACLTVALDRLPRPEHRFALGLDTPLYCAVASQTASLAPEGGAVIHLLRYLEPGEAGHAHRASLEAALTRLQPGWRDALVRAMWLPEMVVQHRFPAALAGGLTARPVPEIAAGRFVAGDWVGAHALLADAAVASAEAAANAIIDRLGRVDDHDQPRATAASRV